LGRGAAQGILGCFSIGQPVEGQAVLADDRDEAALVAGGVFAVEGQLVKALQDLAELLAGQSGVEVICPNPSGGLFAGPGNG
jgi:hypothetical protein